MYAKMDGCQLRLLKGCTSVSPESSRKGGEGDTATELRKNEARSWFLYKLSSSIQPHELVPWCDRLTNLAI
jgi:hypothetical protein